MPPKLSVSQRARKLVLVKDKLRDDLDDIKILVRRTFGAISTELVDFENELVEGCSMLQENCVLQRVMGSNVASQRRTSIHQVFQTIDAMHRSMEEAGIRRKRHNNVSNAGNSTQLPQADFGAEVADGEASDPPAEPSKELNETKSTLTQDALSNKRTTAFSHDNVFSISPFALDLACQLRLSTLSSIRDEVLTGAMLAQRKLVAAKRWVPDAPCPLAASVDGLINEIQAMKKQLLLESPSVSVASLPMVQYPLASINIKQMKHQQNQRTSSPPRQATSSPRPMPAAAPLGGNTIVLQASRTGTAFIEGADARIILAEQQSRLHSTKLKKFLDSTQGRRGPTPISPTPVSPIEPQVEQLSSDDVQKLLRSVKAELQKQPQINSNVEAAAAAETFVPTKFTSSPLCKTPSSKSRQATPSLTSPVPHKFPSRAALTPGPSDHRLESSITVLPQRSYSRGGVATPLSSLSMSPLGQLQHSSVSLL